MPDWNKVLGEIRGALVSAAKEAQANQRATRPGRPSPVRAQPNTCLFWDCKSSISPDYIFCLPHFEQLKDGLVDECPGCNRAKATQYDMCLDCYNDSRKRQRATSTTAKTKKSWYKPEYSATWDAGDSTSNEFYVYILKLDGGEFYAGQTRELRERLSEHRDNRVRTTASRNPKLVYFIRVESREQATKIEVDWKKTIDKNPREIRRWVQSFSDLVRELDYS